MYLTCKTIEEACRAGMKIGKNVSFVGMPHVSSEPYLISIGDNTTVSFDVAFITHDAATRVIRNIPGNDKETVIYGPIKIGKNCFIGARSTILANVEIGDNTIVGAGSVVNKPLPANSVCAGVPCKVICTIDEYIEKHKDDFMYIVSLPPDKKKAVLIKEFSL